MAMDAGAPNDAPVTGVVIATDGATLLPAGALAVPATEITAALDVEAPPQSSRAVAVNVYAPLASPVIDTEYGAVVSVPISTASR